LLDEKKAKNGVRVVHPTGFRSGGNKLINNDLNVPHVE
jgi:hypothetical protein